MNLTPRDLEMFEKLKIPKKLLELAGIIRVSDREARNIYGIQGGGDMAGICFPYFAPESMLNGRRRATARVRRDNSEVEDGKMKKKYVCAWGDHRHLFFPPRPEWFDDINIPVVLVEAEKSALALLAWSDRTGRKILPIAMGGCWGWRGQIGIKETATGERVPERGAIDDLRYCRPGRKVYILLDANCRLNEKVKAARNALERQLLKQKAEVYVLELPASAGVNGPDDFVGQEGDDSLIDLFERGGGSAGSTVLGEDDLALRLSEQSPDLRYVAKWQRWLSFGPPWREDSTLNIFDRTRNICREALPGCGQKSEEKWLKAASTRAAVENMARSDKRHAATVEQWDADLELLGTPTSVIDLRTGDVRPQAPDDYITKSTAVDAGPAADCPLWFEFLNRITNKDAELQKYLHRLTGYCLTGKTS